MIIRTIAIVASLVSCTVVTARGQSPYSQLTLLVDLQTYLAPVYAAERRSPSAFLFFAGEPVTARIRIFNQAATQATLVPRSTDLQQLFIVQTTRDGLPVPLQLEFADRISKFFSGGVYPYSLDQSLQFDQGEGLEWHATVTNGTLPAGLYAINVQVRAADADSRPIGPRQPTLTFEVRTPTEDDKPEILCREVDRQLRRGAYEEAKATLAELRRIHPRSVIAQILRQRIASAEGNRAEAIAAIQQARTLLTTGQDELLAKFRTPEQLRETLQNLPEIRETTRK
jgi:hypothetical protein